MIDVPRAQALHAVAAHGSVRAAAAALHVTPSALSQQLAKLEREIGQPLLAHRGRGVVLTDAGALLVEHIDVILSRITRAETELAALHGAITGRLAISAFATAARALVPPALRRLRDEHPRLHVQSWESDPELALDQLARGDVDLVVVDEWENVSRPAGVSIRPLRPSVTREIYAVWSTDTSRRPAIQAALTTLRQCAAEAP